MAIPARFSTTDLIRLGRTLQGKEMLRAQDLISGKTQPWELPEWRPITEGLRTQHERGLEGLSSAYSQAGVTGPAVALGMERAGEGYEGSLMDIVNKMRGMVHEEAKWGAEMGQRDLEALRRAIAARKARHDAQKQQQFGNIMQLVKMGLQGVAAAGGAVAPGAGAGAGGMEAMAPDPGMARGTLNIPNQDVWSQYSGWTP